MHWRQGDFVDTSDFATIGIPCEAATRAIVISHSCDLAGNEESAELLVGEIIATSAHSNGHSIKLLDVCATYLNETEMVRFKITNRRSIEITTLLKLNPSPYRLSLNERSILKRWLAQRYNRPEFPDAFNVRLGKDKCGLQKPFEEKWAAKYSKSLTGVYFGLDKDEEISDEKELYELKIFLVFDSATTENESRALEARSELIQLFNNRCKRDSQWYLVELLDCVVLSDAEFTIKAANTFKRWRFEHRSVSGEPLDQSA